MTTCPVVSENQNISLSSHTARLNASRSPSCTFFVPTGYINDRKLNWWDRISIILAQARRDGVEVELRRGEDLRVERRRIFAVAVEVERRAEVTAVDVIALVLQQHLPGNRRN